MIISQLTRFGAIYASFSTHASALVADCTAQPLAVLKIVEIRLARLHAYSELGFRSIS
ncbi:hypothetical protein NIES4071_53930 [Calothrix sp. NIES-4071]|nr:hypothetical protein NIES4071_53930 [Calothrix sp. NIES-4071]BAZ59701.1 hypothetical protein NIES4105_53880 [Calothrix sp. NIES-4105]